LVYSALDIYDVYKAHKSELQAEEDWWSRAEALDRAGDRRLLQFLLSRHDLPQLLSKVSKVGHAAEVARRSRLTRPQLLIEALAAFRCTCPWPGRWRSAAEEVVHFNGYSGQEVEAAVLHALAYGRAKQRNVFIVGDTNRAKSFCLKPLAMIYHAFTAPDSGSHQVFVGAGDLLELGSQPRVFLVREPGPGVVRFALVAFFAGPPGRPRAELGPGTHSGRAPSP